MAPAETRTVYLRPGMKFNAVYPKARGKNARFRRKKFVGPCAVEMTEAQIVAFKDLLQTQPQTLVEEPPEEPELGPEDPNEDDSDEEESETETADAAE